MNPDFQPFLKRNQEWVYLENPAKWHGLFDLILKEAIRGTNAKSGAIYVATREKVLSLVSSSLRNKAFGAKLAKHIFLSRKNYLLKKGESFLEEKLQESYICVFLGDEENFLNLGVLILEGINHFENFSLTEFELIQVYARTLLLLISESYCYKDENEIYLKFSTSFLLLLRSTENLQKNIRLEYLLKEVIRVSGLINSSRHLDELLREVMESVKSVFRTESCSLLLVDKQKKDLYFHLVAGEKEKELSQIRVPIGKGIAGTVALTKQPMIINDAQNDDRVYKVVDKTTGFVTRNILAAPLIAGEEVIGVVEAINTIDRNNFSESDIDLFLTFSDSAALAIQKTRLLDDLERSNKELEKTVSELGSLFELSLAINESQKVSELLLKSIRIIAQELHAKRTGIFIQKQNYSFEVYSFLDNKLKSEELELSENSVIYESLQKNRVFIEAFFSKENPDPVDSQFLKGSFVLIPLLLRNEVPFGVLVVSDSSKNEIFGPNQYRLLLTISSQVIKGYENLKLLDNMLAKRAMEKEIEITRNLQKNILPAQKPKGSNFELGVKSVPAKEVSGDFYDFHKYANDQFSFLIADVSGKSLPAAIFMAMSSSIIRTVSRNQDLSPAEILQSANSLIYEDSQSGMFVTLFYIHYNPTTFQIDFASAGHNDQIWIKKDTSYELLKGSGAPLGVIPTSKYSGGTIQVQPGDMIVLYTDGAIEEKTAKDEEYGLERFIEEIIKRKDLSAQKIIEEIYQDIRNFSGTSEQFDDFTVMIIKFNDDYQYRKTFLAHKSQIPIMREYIQSIIKELDLEATILEDILLCCDEAATNIVIHAYKDTNVKNPNFEVAIKIQKEFIEFCFKDKGRPFYRENVPPPSLKANMSGERRGGFGVYLIEHLMDMVEYKRHNEFNEIIIRKNIST